MLSRGETARRMTVWEELGELSLQAHKIEGDGR